MKAQDKSKGMNSFFTALWFDEKVDVDDKVDMLQNVFCNNRQLKASIKIISEILKIENMITEWEE